MITSLERHSNTVFPRDLKYTRNTMEVRRIKSKKLEFLWETAWRFPGVMDINLLHFVPLAQSTVLAHSSCSINICAYVFCSRKALSTVDLKEIFCVQSKEEFAVSLKLQCYLWPGEEITTSRQ